MVIGRRYKMLDKFTQEELLILSDGLLVLMNNVYEAQKLIRNEKIREELDREVDKYQELNLKILELCD